MKKILKPVLLVIVSIALPLLSYAQKGHKNTGTPVQALTVAYYSFDSLGLFSRDTAYYTYSGSRGGYPVLTQYGYWQYSGKFDTLCFATRVDRNSKYYYVLRNIQSFDAHNNLLSETTQYYDTVSHTWHNYAQSLYSYDANNNMLTQLYQDWDTAAAAWQKKTLLQYTYSAANDLLSDTSMSWSAGPAKWVYRDMSEYAYDMHHNNTAYIYALFTSGAWKNIAKRLYYLNAAYKPDSSASFIPSGAAWTISQKNIYTYDGSYNMLADTQYVWDGYKLVYKLADLHIYTYAGTDMLTDEYRTYGPDSAWHNNTNEIRTYDANHNFITHITQSWDTAAGSYVNGYMDTLVFNSDNYLSNITTSVWKKAIASWSGVYKVIYYYGIYTGLHDVTGNTADLLLYPSPAHNYLNIDIKWETSQAATLAIYDMNGRLYRQWTANAGLNYHSNIPTSTLPAGNYILKVQSDVGEQAAQQFSVVH